MRERASQLESLFQEASVGREKVEGRVSEDGLTEKKEGALKKTKEEGRRKKEKEKDAFVVGGFFFGAR